MDVYPSKTETVTVNVRVDRVNAILGTDLSGEEMEEILESLEMEVTRQNNIMKVTPPTVRQDLQEEIDFVEEIARIYGYDRMPVTLPKGNS